MTDKNGLQESKKDLPQDRKRSRQAYSTPTLIEYGKISKLTQSGSGSFSDPSTGRKRTSPCL